MEKEAVNRLINNLYALQGYIRKDHFKILALEAVLKDLGGPHYQRYCLLESEYESNPKTLFPLEDIEGLRKELLRGHQNDSPNL